MYLVVRSATEIDDLLNECIDAEAEGTTRYKGMTFEQGIKYAVEWLTDPKAPHPLED